MLQWHCSEESFFGARNQALREADVRNLTAQYPVISYAVISLEGLLKAELRGGVGFGLPWRLNSERHWVLPPDATLGGAVSVAKWGEALPEEQSR